MGEAMKRGFRKFGWLCMSMLPMLSYFVLMMAVSVAMEALLAILAIMRGERDLVGYLMDYAMDCGVVYAALGIVLFGVWYYFGCGKKRLAPPAGLLSGRNLAGFFLTAFGAQFLISYLVALFSMLFPKAVSDYNELIEESGIGSGFGVAMVLYVMVLGPMAEELVFRGLTLFYLQKSTKRFWLANLLQAAFFGIMHLNLVQGFYAFLLGMLLGWVCHRFHALHASILLHMMFNFLGSGLLALLEERLPGLLVVQILWNLLGIVAFVLGVWLLRKRSPRVAMQGSDSKIP